MLIILQIVFHIKPGMPEHRTTQDGTLAEQQNTPEQWRNNETPVNIENFL